LSFIPGTPFKIKKYFLLLIQLGVIVVNLIEAMSEINPELIKFSAYLVLGLEFVKQVMNFLEQQGIIIGLQLGLVKKKK